MFVTQPGQKCGVLELRAMQGVAEDGLPARQPVYSMISS